MGGELSRIARGRRTSSTYRSALNALVRLGSPRKRASLAAAHDAGFTLVEVIVALAILAAGLSVFLSMISSGLLRTSTAERMVAAGSLTQSLIAEIGTKYPIRPDERVGGLPDGYRWHFKMQSYGNGDDGTPVQLYEISTDVQWEEGGQTRSFQLRTLRVGPKVSRR